MIYEVGDKARLSVVWTDLITSLPTDPTTVVLVVQAPDLTTTTYTSSIAHDGTGLYHQDIPITVGPTNGVSTYSYRWTATGVLSAMEEGQLTVSGTVFQPQAVQPLWTYADLLAVSRAISTGTNKVHFQDRTVESVSTDQLFKLKAQIYLYLYPNTNRQVRMFSNSGL